MVLFPALLVLRRRVPDAPRPYHVPSGAWTAVILAETFVLLGLGLFVTVTPTGGSGLLYTAVTTGSTLVTLLVGIWLSRRRTPLPASGADA